MKLIRCCRRKEIETVHELMTNVANFNHSGKFKLVRNHLSTNYHISSVIQSVVPTLVPTATKTRFMFLFVKSEYIRVVFLSFLTVKSDTASADQAFLQSQVDKNIIRSRGV